MTHRNRAILMLGVLLASVLVGCGSGGTSSSGDPETSAVCYVLNGPTREYCIGIVEEISQLDCEGIESGLAMQYFRVHMNANQAETTQILIAAYENRADDFGCDVDPCPGLAEILTEQIKNVEQGEGTNVSIFGAQKAMVDQGCS